MSKKFKKYLFVFINMAELLILLWLGIFYTKFLPVIWESELLFPEGITDWSSLLMIVMFYSVLLIMGIVLMVISRELSILWINSRAPLGIMILSLVLTFCTGNSLKFQIAQCWLLTVISFLAVSITYILSMRRISRLKI